MDFDPSEYGDEMKEADNTMNIKPNADEARVKNLRLHQGQTDTLWVYLLGPWRDLAGRGEDCGPFEVLHDCGSRIWFWGNYSDELPEGAIHVGDGKSSGYDIYGSRIISVPVDWCYFLDNKEAIMWFQVRDIDEAMLRNAY